MNSDVDTVLMSLFPANIYLFKVNNENTITMFEICSNLTTETLERRRYGVFLVNFEKISHILLVFPLFTLSK